jgi:hypothetical protein
MVLHIRNLTIISSAKVILLLQVLFILSACQQVWYLTVTDASDLNHPQFCFSRFDNCEGYGPRIDYLMIDEVDEERHMIRPMWRIESVEDVPLKEVTYGFTPKGYGEVMKAKPLEVGKWYSVQSAYFFRLTKSGDQNQVEVISLKEFSKKIREERKKGQTP